MAVPTNKSLLIIDINTSYQKLKKELSNITAHESVIKNLEGHAKGTKMSLNNLLAYLLGWGNLVLKWNEGMAHNRPVDFPETGFKWNELGKLAGKFYADYENLDYKSLVEALDKNVTQILQLIEEKTNTALYETAWYKQWTLGRMIQFNTSSPYRNASARIRKWKKENS